MESVVEAVFQAAHKRTRLFLSTPNLNFLVQAQNDFDFRRSLVASDLCPADGIGVLLVCRLLGLKHLKRVAGSDLPTALQKSRSGLLNRPVRIALFGGAPGVGQRASDSINSTNGNLVCVCAIDPGNISQDAASSRKYVEALNITDADFLLVALGAQKGQRWIMQSLPTLTIPAVSHLGATINFLAGAVIRAPRIFQKSGLEWLWRIKEEPKLIRRYAADGAHLAALLLRRAIPLTIWLRQMRKHSIGKPLTIEMRSGAGVTCRLSIAGYAVNRDLADVSEAFRSACASAARIELDLSGLAAFDLAFAGKLLMLEHHATTTGKHFRIVECARAVHKAIQHCGLGHLVDHESPGSLR